MNETSGWMWLTGELLDAQHRLGPGAAAAICPLTRHRRRDRTLDGSVQQFLESQAAGCFFCCLVINAADTAKPGWIAEHRDHGCIRAAPGVGNGFLCQVWTSDRSDSEFDFACSILHFTESPAEDLESWIPTRFDSQDAVATRIIPDTRSTAAFAKISGWLRTCLERHGTSCGSTSYFPRRVLDIGFLSEGQIHGNSNSDGDSIRLIQAPSSSSRTQDTYAALSYCWGPDTEKMAKTTRANLPSHLDGITLASLPRTFQDAVMVCRNLKVRYLWVDSMCIVQDDEEDWERESAEMHAIYSSSYLTIAAHVGASVHDGFLGAQRYGHPAWQTEMQASLHLRNGAGDKTELKTFEFLLRMGDSSKETSPLEIRGWTMQECMLSPRILHFTQNEMVWECNRRHVCECLNLSGGNSEHIMLKTRTEIARWDGGPPLHSKWEVLVELYTRRKLSFESDKLIAVAALARKVVVSSYESVRKAKADASLGADGAAVAMARIRHIYIAGLFRHALHRHLLWRTGELAIGDARAAEYAILQDASWGRRPLQYRAPTWSWASVNTPVVYNFLPDKPLQSRIVVNHEECFTTLAIEMDPTGPVTYAQLSLQGRAVPVKVLTADYPGDQAEDFDFEGNRNWTGTATAVRSSNGYWVRVAADLRRDVELTSRDTAYRCWMSGGCDPEDKGPTCGSSCKQCGIRGDDWNEASFCCFQVAVGSYAVYFLVLQRSTRTSEAWERIAIGMDWINSTRLFETAEDRNLQIV